MTESVVLFKKHIDTIENFLMNIVDNNSLASSDEINVESSYKNLDALRTLYLVDFDYKQISASYFPNSKDNSRIGINKSRYFSNLVLNERNMYLTNPYIHYKTGRACVTLVKKTEHNFVVFDIDLLTLLEELRLTKHNNAFDKMNKYVYAIGGYSLSIISLFLIIYGGFVFLSIFFDTSENAQLINEIFKSIIAITLGLAIYDLAKTIISHEVLFKDIEESNEGQYHILGKFLISIIIALSIESLMVVFKIALDDYTALGYAFLLILGVTIMIVGLGKFHYYTRNYCEPRK